jgi:hypothetical protein
MSGAVIFVIFQEQVSLHNTRPFDKSECIYHALFGFAAATSTAGFII